MNAVNPLTYKLPQHVAAALATARPELLKLGPVELDEAAQREVLRLLSDMIEERRHMQDKLELMGQVVAEATRTVYGNARKLEASMEALLTAPNRDEMHDAIKRRPQEE